MKVAVIGSSGGMGSFFVRYFLSRGHDVAGSDIVAPRRSVRSGRFVFFSSNAEAVRESDVVLLASPIDTTASVAGECVRSMKHGSTLVEISSVKGRVLPELRRLTSENGVMLLSIHPLFGPSLRLSRRMKLIVISDCGMAERAESLFADAEIVEVTTAEHDRLVAVTLALTHLVNMLYAKTAAKYVRPDQLRKVSTPTSTVQLALAEGVLSQNPELYSYVQVENQNTPEMIRTLLQSVKEVLRMVERGDRSAFETLYSQLSEVYSEDAREHRSLSEVYRAFERTAR